MFDVGHYLGTVKNHLPKGFNAKNGLRSLFPPGYKGSISPLENYVFRCLSPQVGDIQILVGADGDGRWLVASLANAPSDPDIQASFVFQHSTDSFGHGFDFDCPSPAGAGTPGPQWGWITGVDPWIKENWPSIFAKSCYFNNDNLTPGDAAKNHGFASGLAPFEGAQQTFGYSAIFGEDGLGVVEPNGYETPCTGYGMVLNGLPVSAGSDYYYDPTGGGYYKNGGEDPWKGFDFSPFQISSSTGIGKGSPAWAGPDPSLQTGTQDVYTGWGRNVICVLLNNTKSSVLTVPTITSLSANGANVTMDPPSPVLPGTAVVWATGISGVGTQGSLQYYATPLGDPLIDLALDSNRIITFNWDNPYVGSNSYSASCSPPFSVTYQGGDGDTAVVIFNLTD